MKLIDEIEAYIPWNEQEERDREQLLRFLRNNGDAFLRDNAAERADAMVEYASETDVCRSRFLLRWFGQEESTDCGCCDVCRAAGKTATGNTAAGNTVSAKNAAASHMEAVLDFFRQHPGANLADFRSWCADPSGCAPPDAVKLLRSLIDSGEIGELK